MATPTVHLSFRKQLFVAYSATRVCEAMYIAELLTRQSATETFPFSLQFPFLLPAAAAAASELVMETRSRASPRDAATCDTIDRVEQRLRTATLRGGEPVSAVTSAPCQISLTHSLTRYLSLLISLSPSVSLSPSLPPLPLQPLFLVH